MRTHAVFLRLDGRRCVVVGCDRHVEGKIEACWRAGGAVGVIAPEVTPAIASLVAHGAVRHAAHAWQPGDLQVAVGTGGASPALAARLRRELEARIGPEYRSLVEILGAVRRVFDGDPRRAAVVSALVESPLLELLRRGHRAGVEQVLAEHTGERCMLAGLGVSVGV